MELNKLDKEFKDKLDKRVIAPTEMAWDRLDAMLSTAEGKKPKSNKNWMYIAAGFIGFILAATLFFKNDTNTHNNPEINTSNSVVTKQSAPVIRDTQTVQAIKNEVTNSLPEKFIVKKDAVVNVVKKDKEQVTIKNWGSDVQAITPDKRTIVSNQVAAHVPDEGFEVQSLLEQATVSNKAKKQTIKIDASKLLHSVENELDDNFRAKTLQTITKNYNVIRSTLANRNHQ